MSSTRKLGNWIQEDMDTVGKLHIANYARLMGDNQETLDLTNASDQAYREQQLRVINAVNNEELRKLGDNGSVTQPTITAVPIVANGTTNGHANGSGVVTATAPTRQEVAAMPNLPQQSSAASLLWPNGQGGRQMQILIDSPTETNHYHPPSPTPPPTPPVPPPVVQPPPPALQPQPAVKRAVPTWLKAGAVAGAVATALGVGGLAGSLLKKGTVTEKVTEVEVDKTKGVDLGIDVTYEPPKGTPK